MIIVSGWFCKPKIEEKSQLYKFMGVFLTDAFVHTYKRQELSDLVLTKGTKFVGNFLNLQEVHEVINLKEPYKPFYVTDVVKNQLDVLLAKLVGRHAIT